MTKPGPQQHPTIESLKERVARDPFSRAFLQLAEEYRRLGRFKEAIEVCREGLQRHPTYHTARIALGRTQMEAGHSEDARRTFAEVLDLQPENHLAGKLLAEIQRKSGDRDGAVVTYRGILRYYPDDREVATLLQETLSQGPASETPAPRPPEPALQPKSPGPSPAMIQPPRGEPQGAPPPDPSPEFRAEDLGGTPFAVPRETWSPPQGPVVARWPEPVPEFREEPLDDAMQTNTLAEVYLRQGLVDKAIEVFRGMLRVDPTNERAAARLNELAPADVPLQVPASTGLVAARSDTIDSTPWPRLATPLGASSTQTAAPTAQAGARRETIRRLERWLATVSGEAAKGAPPR